MICKDCELEAPKLNRDGICLTCARRKANMKWKGVKYVPLKDMKGTHAYKIAIAKRGIEPKEVEEVEEVEEPEEKEVETPEFYACEFPERKTEFPVLSFMQENFKDKCYEMVINDAKKKFKENHLDINFYKNIDLKTFLMIFTELLENKYIYEDCKKAEEIFNGLSIDYDHYLEETEWDEAKNLWGLKKALLELRRPNQNFAYNYSIIKDLLDYLRRDKDFMKLLDIIREKVEKRQPNIYGARASELVANQDFATKRKVYWCEVGGHNLYGQKGYDIFKTKIEAINEENAKEKLNIFLARKFASFSFNQDDIKITEMEG